MEASHARSGSLWRSRTATPEERGSDPASVKRRRKFYVGPLLMMVFVSIEALIATRIVGQATAQNPDWWVFGAVLTITDFLLQPFRDIRPEPALKETGVVEFTAILAFEAYLVAFLALIFLVQATRSCAWLLRSVQTPRHRALRVAEPVPPQIAIEPQPPAGALEPEPSEQAAA